MFTEKKYHAWKAKDSTCEPIEGTDRILKGKSKRAVLDHLAYEENVVRQHYSLVVNRFESCPDCKNKLYLI